MRIGSGHHAAGWCYGGAQWAGAVCATKPPALASVRADVDSRFGDVLEIENLRLRAAERAHEVDAAGRSGETGQEWRPVKMPELPPIPERSERVRVEIAYKIVNTVSRGSLLDVLA